MKNLIFRTFLKTICLIELTAFLVVTLNGCANKTQNQEMLNTKQNFISIEYTNEIPLIDTLQKLNILDTILQSDPGNAPEY